MFCLIDMFSIIASTIKEQLHKSFNSCVGMNCSFDNIIFFLLDDSFFLDTYVSNTLCIIAIPFCKAASELSTKYTLYPPIRKAMAIPLPMVPAPITATSILGVVALGSFSNGCRGGGACVLEDDRPVGSTTTGFCAFRTAKKACRRAFPSIECNTSKNNCDSFSIPSWNVALVTAARHASMIAMCDGVICGIDNDAK